MNKQVLEEAKQALSILRGQKLQNVTRAATMADFGFGDLIEKEVPKLASNGTFVKQKVSVSKYALQVECFFRLTCGSNIILSRGDMFQPCSEIERGVGFDISEFEWDVYGHNRFDELVKRHFAEQPFNFIVKNAAVNRYGDITIAFDNHFVLETCPDVSGAEECWRFFETDSKKPHFIVTGLGSSD